MKKAGLYDRLEARKQAMNDKIQAYPRLATRLDTLRDVWAETFPNAERDVKRRQEQRKKLAKMAREQQEKEEQMTPEEIAEMERNVPEWKRNALVAADPAQAEEEKIGILGGIKSRISSTKAAQNFYGTEEYEKLNVVRGNYQEFKDKLKVGVEES